MKKAALVLIFLCLISPAQANVLSSFIKGNEAYKEQKYDEAAAHYEEIILDGKRSGPIYFNLANAYYKSGNLGRAVLNYKRARRLIPRDSDVDFNRKYTESSIQRTDRMERNSFEKLIDGHIQFYTFDEMILIITLSIFALGWLFLLSRFFKWSQNIRYLSRFICVLVIFIFTIGLMLKAGTEQNLAILLDKTPAYFEPLAASTEHFQLYEGNAVKIVSEQDGWVKVKRLDGLLGWVPASSVEEI